MVSVSEEAKNFNWLLVQFVQQTDGVQEAIAVSSDGLLLAASAGRTRANVEQFAAVISGLTSLANGAAQCFEFDTVEQYGISYPDTVTRIRELAEGRARSETIGVDWLRPDAAQPRVGLSDGREVSARLVVLATEGSGGLPDDFGCKRKRTRDIGQAAAKSRPTLRSFFPMTLFRPKATARLNSTSSSVAHSTAVAPRLRLPLRRETSACEGE